MGETNSQTTATLRMAVAQDVAAAMGIIALYWYLGLRIPSEVSIGTLALGAALALLRVYALGAPRETPRPSVRRQLRDAAFVVTAYSTVYICSRHYKQDVLRILGPTPNLMAEYAPSITLALLAFFVTHALALVLLFDNPFAERR